MSYSQHETAIIDPGAQIGADTRIWHFAHVCAGAVIGERCSLGQNVFIANRVVIGSNVKIQNNVSVYEGVTLEDDVFCGPSMVFTNVYNPRSAVTRKEEYRDTLVKKGATLGANCTIVCGVTIGEYAFIGAGAVVNKDVKPYALMVGVPARAGVSEEVALRARAMRERLDAIRNAPLPADDQLPELTQKQLERIAALAITKCQSEGGRLWLYVGSVQTLEYVTRSELKRMASGQGRTLSERQLAIQTRNLLQEFVQDKHWLAALAGEGPVFDVPWPR